MRHTSTHTYAILEVSLRTYTEIKQKLEAAGYQGQFHDNGVIDLNGLAVKAKELSLPKMLRKCIHCKAFEGGPFICTKLGGRHEYTKETS